MFGIGGSPQRDSMIIAWNFIHLSVHAGLAYVRRCGVLPRGRIAVLGCRSVTAGRLEGMRVICDLRTHGAAAPVWCDAWLWLRTGPLLLESADLIIRCKGADDKNWIHKLRQVRWCFHSRFDPNYRRIQPPQHRTSSDDLPPSSMIAKIGSVTSFFHCAIPAVVDHRCLNSEFRILLSRSGLVPENSKHSAYVDRAPLPRSMCGIRSGWPGATPWASVAAADHGAHGVSRDRCHHRAGEGCNLAVARRIRAQMAQVWMASCRLAVVIQHYCRSDNRGYFSLILQIPFCIRCPLRPLASHLTRGESHPGTGSVVVCRPPG